MKTSPSLERIRPDNLVFLTAECRYGALLMARTSRGICAIELGDSQEELTTRFLSRFPQAQCQPDDPDSNQWLPLLQTYMEDPNQSLNIPFDIQGTEFQRKVWSTLQDIPSGTTLTYAELAQKIGQPTAVRAVANACSRNVLAVAIPCHRAVRTDRGLSNFRWGQQRKTDILQHEFNMSGIPDSLF